jgi:exodeoxyribonuclease VII small subunit
MEQKMTFEQAMLRLEEITKQLERGDVPLEQSLAYFEEGTNLVKMCRQLLDSAEQKVKILTKTQDGELELSDFEAEDDK